MIRSLRTLGWSLFALGACGDHRATVAPLPLLSQPYVVISADTNASLPSPLTLAGESRPVMSAPLPAEFRFKVRVPPRALMTFAIAISETSVKNAASLPADRLRFAISVGETIPDTEIFAREIHLSRRNEWIEQVVDMQAFEEREIWMSFKTSMPGPYSGELSVTGLFADPVLHDRARYREGRSVVVISIDTLRRDHTSLYGYQRRTTPGLDALAQESVVFEDAISTSSWTLPAHASLFTSTYPSVHGAVNLDLGLQQNRIGLPSILSNYGFFSQAIVTHLYLSKQYGFDNGFDRHRYLPETRAAEVSKQAMQFLQAKGDRDFFLFLHYYDPHWHYDPPAPYDKAFDPNYQGSATGVWWDFKDKTKEKIDPAELNHIISLYDGEILYTDHYVQEVVREMKRLGVFDKSLIIVTSDHGEEFLDHGSWEHQKTLYEEQLRIPLLLKLPRSDEKSSRIEGQVSLIDIAPTILDALSIPVPNSFQGESLLEQVYSRSTSGRVQEAWSETEHTLDGSHLIAKRTGFKNQKSLFTLAEGSRNVVLFDLLRDPTEQHPLTEDGVAEAIGALDAFLRNAQAQRGDKVSNPGVKLSPEEEERLRSLGYVR